MEGNALHYFWMTFVTWAGLAYLFFNSKICKDFHIKSKTSASALTPSFSQHRDKRDVSEEVNEWCIYIAILCVLLYTQSAVQSWGEVSSQPPPVCSIHLDDATASHRTIAPVHSPHTSYRWRGERVKEPIKWMGIIRRPWLTGASGGNLARTLGLHPYSLREVPWPQRVRTSV